MTSQRKPDTATITAISQLGRQFSDTTILLHEAIARKAGLTGADHKYLGILVQNGAMTAGEFSKLTGLTTGAITGLVDRLAKKKLAKRTFDKNDRRKIIIVPDSDNAMKLLGPTFHELQTKMVDLITTLTAPEKKIIEKYLHSTIAIMQAITNNLNK